VTTGRDPSGDHRALLETLRLAQRFGVLGGRPVEEAVEHARAFSEALGPVVGRVVDLGSGGGLPGLVVAFDRPDLEVVLVDRRQKRTDLLERAVTRLGMESRVTVHCGDATRLPDIYPGGFEGVTARGFGPPGVTLRTAEAVLALGAGARIVISEPPHGDRWRPDMLEDLGLSVRRLGPVAIFTRA
jgi:16S rRNA (guanine527-N7)-methyltransferase